MNAEITAQRVLGWAVTREGTLPSGPLWETARLGRPGRATRVLAGELARRTAATLGIGVPAPGDATTIGLGTVFLAAAVGGRGQPEPARRLAELARPAGRRAIGPRWYDLVALHGLVAAVLRDWRPPPPSSGTTTTVSTTVSGDGDEPEPLDEILLRVSPLSAVLHRPPLRKLAARATGEEVATAVELLARPRGAATLAAGLASWSPDHTVLSWRVELMRRLRADHPDAVLDIHCLARSRHGAEWDRRLSWARRALNRLGPPDPLAIATVEFWAPLFSAVRSGTELARVRPLLQGHEQALQLVRFHNLDKVGAR
ncbi:hypothetical protein [Streptosporangium sp. H16]|uniref:hypothetical protein n=1 Tax=Streptosporangium sp. H16 TaxID=3444184 RepID=UPI003F7B2450